MNEVTGIIYRVVNLTKSSNLVCLITPSGKKEFILKGGQSNHNRYRGICQYLNLVTIKYEKNYKIPNLKIATLKNIATYLVTNYGQAVAVSQMIKLVASFNDINFNLLYDLLVSTIYVTELSNQNIINFYIQLSSLMGSDILLLAKEKHLLDKTLNTFLINGIITDELINYLVSFYQDYLGITLQNFLIK